MIGNQRVDPVPDPWCARRGSAEARTSPRAGPAGAPRAPARRAAPTSASTSLAASTPVSAARSISPHRNGGSTWSPATRSPARVAGDARAGARRAGRERRAPWPRAGPAGARRGRRAVSGHSAAQLGAHAGGGRGGVGRGAGVGVQLDHRSAGARRPLRRRALQPGVDGDRVERRLAAHGVERRRGSGATSRSSQSRVTANGGATTQAAACRASSARAPTTPGERQRRAARRGRAPARRAGWSSDAVVESRPASGPSACRARGPGCRCAPAPRGAPGRPAAAPRCR